MSSRSLAFFHQEVCPFFDFFCFWFLPSFLFDLVFSPFSSCGYTCVLDLIPCPLWIGKFSYVLVILNTPYTFSTFVFIYNTFFSFRSCKWVHSFIVSLLLQKTFIGCLHLTNTLRSKDFWLEDEVNKTVSWSHSNGEQIQLSRLRQLR